MDAILDSEALAYKLLSTTKELNEAAQGFKSLSSHGAIKVCVACFDGFYYKLKCLQEVREATSRHIFLVTIKHMA